MTVTLTDQECVMLVEMLGDLYKSLGELDCEDSDTAKAALALREKLEQARSYASR